MLSKSWISLLLLFCWSTSSQAQNYPSWEQQVDTARRSHWAMTEFTGSHFQSCEPLFHPDEDPVAIMQEIWGSDPNVNQKQCKDRRNADFRYQNFGDGSINPGAGELELYGNKLDSFGRFNCSGFAAGTLAAAGFKHYTSQPSWENLIREPVVLTHESGTEEPSISAAEDTSWFSPRTRDLKRIFRRNDTCFFKPWIGKGRSLLPGDYINVSDAHVVRVYSVGEDPLGLKKVERRSDCENIQKKNFDFTIIHSSSFKKEAGFSGVKIENAKNASPSLITKLATFTRELCYDTFKDGQLGGGRLKDVKVGEEEVLFNTYDKVFMVRRHFGSFKSQCVMDPAPYTRGQWCLETSCFRKTKNQSAFISN